MRILAFSEHFFPRVGGTVSYVHRICESLTLLGHDVHLVVPGECTDIRDVNGCSYRVTGIGVGWPREGDPSREVRYRFCRQADTLALKEMEAGNVDIMHVLFGLFLNESLNTNRYKRLNVPCVTTVHNVPPQECSRSWPGDSRLSFLKDCLRLKLVTYKNNRRLRSHAYSAYVVPSAYVKNVLEKTLTNTNTEVIGHGYSEQLTATTRATTARAPEEGQKLKILTVGGWVPHKRQHLIPEIAAKLRSDGLMLEWNIVGPSGRLPRYQQAVKNIIKQHNVTDIVRIHDAVPFLELSKFYQAAHLYIQPSTEEGFCMTALDAAAVGLPVLACPTGALPEIARLSDGIIVQSNSNDLADAVRHFMAASLWKDDTTDSIKAVRETFSWEQSAKKLQTLYFSLLDQAQTPSLV